MSVSTEPAPILVEEVSAVRKTAPRRRRASRTTAIPQYALLIIVALVMLFPIYWIFVSSIKTLNDISASPPIFIPTNPQWQNYVLIFQQADTALYFRNSLILVVVNTVFTLISSSLVAYPLARLQFRGKGAIFALILATMMVPAVAVVVPQYLLFRQFGWLDSLLPLTVPALFAAPYNVFLFRQFFLTIPSSIDEAARLDGCSSFQVFFRMVVPLAKPVFVTVGVLSAISWLNELFLPLVFINSEDLKPITLGAITAFTQPGGQHAVQWNELMAFAMLMALPPIVIYMVANRWISGGIKTTGAK